MKTLESLILIAVTLATLPATPGCTKQNTVIIEYDQPFNVVSARVDTFPNPVNFGIVKPQAGTNGLWVVYDIREVSNSFKDAALFELKRDAFTTA